MRQVHELQVSTIRRRELSVPTRPGPSTIGSYGMPSSASAFGSKPRGQAIARSARDGVKPFGDVRKATLTAAGRSLLPDARARRK
jgi:hypothetical protein